MGARLISSMSVSVAGKRDTSDVRPDHVDA